MKKIMFKDLIIGNLYRSPFRNDDIMCLLEKNIKYGFVTFIFFSLKCNRKTSVGYNVKLLDEKAKFAPYLIDLS